MINANEARTKTEKSLEKEAEDDLKKICSEIEKECEKGNYELNYRGIVGSEAISVLRNKGYKVKYSCGEFDDFGNFYEGYIKISWRRDKNWKIKIKNLFHKL